MKQYQHLLPSDECYLVLVTADDLELPLAVCEGWGELSRTMQGRSVGSLQSMESRGQCVRFGGALCHILRVQKAG